MALARSEGFRTLLQKKDFLKLWLAQVISMTILYASNYALLVLIQEVTGSTTLVGLAIICFSLPAVICGAPAGVLVDRMNKKRVLWISNWLRAIATFVFVISLLFDRHQLIPIYLLTLLISTIGQFFTPAEGSAIPMLVSKEELVPALSLFNITFMLSNALGFILLAPILLALLPTFSIGHLTIHPVEQLYAIIGLLYAVCALLIMLIPRKSFVEKTDASLPAKDVASETMNVFASIWGEIRQAWSFIRRNKILFLAIIQLSFAGVLILVIGELATSIVTNLLGLSAKAMAFIFAPAGIGLVVGSILMPHISKVLGKSRAILIGTITLAIAMVLIPLITFFARVLMPHSWVGNPLVTIAVAFCMLIAGFALDFINIPAQTAIQEQTPDWIKGRVLALQLMLYNACSIPIILFIGAFADLFGIGRVLYAMAVCVLGFGLWGIFYERRHPTASANTRTTAPLTEEPEPVAPLPVGTDDGR